MKTFNSKGVFVSSLLGICLALGAYAVRNSYAKKQLVIEGLEGKTTMRIGRVRTARLADPVTDKIVPLDPIPQNGHRLLLFLSAADCSSCLNILSAIKTLPARVPREKLAIDTVFVRSSSDEVKQYLKDLDTHESFPVYLDSLRDVEVAVGLPQRTPVAVVVDAQFDVELGEPATTSEAEQKRFVESVVQLTKKEK
jgi:hypothetical protein